MRFSRNWDHELQQAGESAVLQLWQAESDGDCACETCTVREVLTAVWPIVELWAKAQSA